jgi:phosphoribosylamine--glycine ligase
VPHHILFVSVAGDGPWFVHLLQHEGHKVDWICASERDADALSGIIPPPLKHPPHPARYDLIIFDSSSLGEAADDARALTPTIGSSAIADRMEHDRIFGIEVMEKAGIQVPPWEAFTSAGEAISWLKSEQKRTVLKPVGEAPSDMTYVSSSAEDMIAFIEQKLDKKVKSFVLQEFVSGTEVSTEAYWTGKEWVALNHTLEEKKLMSGGIGPNTGCAGNVLWMPDRPNTLFEQGLAKVAPFLEASGVVGMFDLNTIVTEGGVYGLEWTPRFGYEGTCNLTALLPCGFGDFLYSVAIGQAPTLAQPRARFAATVRLSVPPYPSAEFSRRHDQVPIEGINLDRLERFVLYDVQRGPDDQLHTGGHYQVIGSPIGCGESIDGAFDEVMTAIKGLRVPNLQYRNDLASCCTKRYTQLQTWGWLRSVR